MKRYRYVGKERDDESGFIYIGARYYCPWLARWLEVDPINNEWYNLSQGNPGRNMERQFVELTASSYEYCYANPVRFTDPNGEQVPQKIGYVSGAATQTNIQPAFNAIPATQPLSGSQSNSQETNKSIYFMLGASNAVITNFMGGFGRVSPENVDGLYSIDYARGQLAGDVASIGIGSAMTTGGTVGGVATSETGVGALGGAVVASWGRGVTITGTINAAKSTQYVLHFAATDNTSGSSGGPRDGGSIMKSIPTVVGQTKQN